MKQWWTLKSLLRPEGRSIQPGVAPGTLVAHPNAVPTTIECFGYRPESEPDEYEECIIRQVDDLTGLMKKWPCVWVNVVGMEDLTVIQQLGEHFNLHRLALEDVLNVNQRCKVEDYDDTTFMVLRYVTLDPGLSSEQISLFVGDHFVLSFQERPGDCFDGVRDRLRKGKRRIRVGSGYLSYALLDSVVDHFYPLLETFGERLEDLEEEVLEEPEKSTVARLHSIKRDLVNIRRTVWPMRELVSTLLREESAHFQGENALFIRDCQDHVLQVIELVEHYRDITTGLIDVYLSSISNRMNEVMRVLTLIATIFIPLSFIAGLYGMNFKYMPELEFRYGYFFALGGMAAVALGFIVYLKKKKWL